MMMEVSSRHEGDVLILGFKGKLIGEPHSTPFIESVRAAAEKGERKVVLDLSAVDWINSTGISMLLAARDLLQRARAALRLSAINKSVSGVLAISKVDQVFEIHPSTEAAVRSFV